MSERYLIYIMSIALGQAEGRMEQSNLSRTVEYTRNVKDVRAETPK